jgi:hypothetical protein
MDGQYTAVIFSVEEALDPEYEGIAFLSEVYNIVSAYTVSHSRPYCPSQSPLWEHQTQPQRKLNLAYQLFFV